MLKSYGWVGWWVAHKILVSAPVPLELILTGFDWVGAGVWVLGRGLTIGNSILNSLKESNIQCLKLCMICVAS